MVTSRTPRTDFQLKRYYDDATGERKEYVEARFARQLERELNQRNEQVLNLKAEIKALESRIQ